MMYSAIATAIGGGISAYNSFQSAATQKNIANYNYAMQQRNAKMQLMSNTVQVKQIEQQARFQKAEAEINARLAENEAQARNNNAQNERNVALAQASVDRENIRRGNMDADQKRAVIRASQGKSGGQLDAGSLMETDVKAAQDAEIAAEEQHRMSDIGYRQSFAKAALEDFGAEMARAGASMDLATGLAEARLTRSSAALQEATGKSQYLMDQKRAEIARVSGYADAKGSQLSGWGSLFQTAGSVGSSWANWQHVGPSSSWGGKANSTSQRPPGFA
ncbi:hypothetical protein [Verrucomicrobium sp. BvORR106]|uniref:hypothetical protein n=1 Tax=Verrucomicrobium sp. BvORR106 TaxID=1403819 RepID=UPI000570AB95|nr:hypothetical protein [Verrucomicrobium sp. BvORR106]